MSLTVNAPLTSSDAGGHWYTEEGQSAHDADLRRARKENLYPSVTSVMQIKAKPALDAWKQQQVILAALTLPRLPGETADDYAARVVQDWKSQSNQAAVTGTALHDFAERVTNGESPAPVAGFESLCAQLREWIENNLGHGQAEGSMVNKELGYAGRVDWRGKLKDGRPAIVDFKSQGVKPGKRPTFYPEWISQLVAYGDGSESFVYISVVMSTNPESPVIEAYEWTLDEARKGWEVFKHCLALWQLDRNYRPAP